MSVEQDTNAFWSLIGNILLSKYHDISYFNPNKAGLFEGSFLWRRYISIEDTFFKKPLGGWVGGGGWWWGVQSKTVLFLYNLQTYNWGQNCLCLISYCWRTLLLSLTCYLFSLKILQTLFEALQIDSKNLLGPGDHSLSACTKYAHVSVRIRG